MDMRDHVEDMAKELAGNHLQFEAFAWWERPDDARNWAIVSLSHRDNEDNARLASNTAALQQALDQFTAGDDPDVRFATHRHWGPGFINVLEIRVYRDGQVTDAFATYAELAMTIEQHGVIDSADYSERRDAAMTAAVSAADLFVRTDDPAWVERVKAQMTPDWIEAQGPDHDDPYLDHELAVGLAIRAGLLDIDEFCDRAAELEIGPATLYTMAIGAAPDSPSRVLGAYVLKIGDRLLRLGCDFTCLRDQNTRYNRLPRQHVYELADMLVPDPGTQEIDQDLPEDYRTWLHTPEAAEVRFAIYDLLNPEEE